jgi:WS/DGAT/MGAT family acyltransferase
LSPLDALLLTSDSSPAHRAIMTIVLVLDGQPQSERVYAAFARATEHLPRMTQRVRTAPLTGGTSWRADPRFALGNHIRVEPAPGDGSLHTIFGVAGQRATEKFTSAHPLWDATLYEGVDGGDSALVLRIHHAVADGIRLLQMLTFLLEPEAGPPASHSHQPSIRIPVSGPLNAVEDLARDAARLFEVRQGQAEYFLLSYLAAASRPVGAMSDISAYVKSARRTFDTGDAKPSRLLRGRSLQRQFHTLEVPLEAMRRAARSNDATINDIYLAALLEGLALYHDAHGESPGDIPMSFPINIGGNDIFGEGNHFSAAAIPGPASIRDPVKRIRAVHRLVAARRAEHGVDALVRLAPALQEVPAPLTEMGVNAYAQRIDLQASNVIGPESPTFLAGAPVRRFFGFAPSPGIPLMVLLVSTAGTCTLGFTIDPAAITGPDLLLRCVANAFSEILHAQ